MSEPLSIESVKGARRYAIAVDLAAVGASLAANVAAAPATVGGWLVAAVSPLALFAVIGLAHRAQGILGGWIGRAFNTGLAAIAVAAAWISYGHLQHVAIEMGQSPGVARVIPLVIDGAAVLASLIVVAAGSKITALQLEAEQAAAVEREAVRAAELAKREALEAERRAEAKAKADAVERAAALEARQAAVKASTSKASTKDKAAAPKVDRAVTGAAIAAYVAEHPDATAAEVGAAIGATDRTVRRYSEWTDRPAAQNNERQPA